MKSGARCWRRRCASTFRSSCPVAFSLSTSPTSSASPIRAMPRIQADTVSQKRLKVTRADVLAAKRAYPHYNRYQLAALLGVSEQTVQRRLEHNNVRGGKYATQTRVRLVGGLVEQWGAQAGFYLYDRRVWAKDPAWENSRWHSSSYRSVDEFEYLYVFWKPGITTVDRQRLSPDEWQAWGSRGVWHVPSVRANDDHPAKFPLRTSAPGGAPLLRAGRGGAGLLCRQRHDTGGSNPRGPAVPRHRPAAGVRDTSQAQLSPRYGVAPAVSAVTHEGSANGSQASGPSAPIVFCRLSLINY